MDTKEEIKLKQQQEEEECQEEVDTLNSLVDHYKKEAEEAKASRRKYEVKWLEESSKISQQEEMIAKLTQEGVDLLPEQHIENLKEGMRHIR